MKSLKFYKYFAFIMLIINIAAITFFMFNKPKGGLHPHKMGPPRMLNLNESQAQQFDLLARQHREGMRTIMEHQKSILDTYFQSLINTELANNDTSLSVFCDLEKQKIKHTYHHFQEVKNILNDDQLNNFEEFVKKTLHMIHGGGKRRHHPPPNH